MMPAHNFQMVQQKIIYGEGGEGKTKKGKREGRKGRESSKGRNHVCPHCAWHTK